MNICLRTNIKHLFFDYLKGALITRHHLSSSLSLWLLCPSLSPFQHFSETLRSMRGSLWLVWEYNVCHAFPTVMWGLFVSGEDEPLRVETKLVLVPGAWSFPQPLQSNQKKPHHHLQLFLQHFSHIYHITGLSCGAIFITQNYRVIYLSPTSFLCN